MNDAVAASFGSIAESSQYITTGLGLAAFAVGAAALVFVYVRQAEIAALNRGDTSRSNSNLLSLLEVLADGRLDRSAVRLILDAYRQELRAKSRKEFMLAAVAIVSGLLLFIIAIVGPPPSRLVCERRQNHMNSTGGTIQVALTEEEEKRGFRVVAAWCAITPVTIQEHQGYDMRTVEVPRGGISCTFLSPPNRQVTANMAICRVEQAGVRSYRN